MNRTIISIAVIICILTGACKKHDDSGASGDPLEGSYTGTFQRVTGTAGPISHVSLTFQNGNVTGTSDSAEYPGICHAGSYLLSGANNVTVQDSCFWTANFDWTLIFSGQYQYTHDSGMLIITRVYPGIIYQADIYKLHQLQTL